MHPWLLRRATDVVGAVTLGMGAALVAAPGRTSAVLGLGPNAGLARGLGLVDLAIAPGLLRAENRWPWMGARAGFNAVLAGCYGTTQPCCRFGRHADRCAASSRGVHGYEQLEARVTRAYVMFVAPGDYEFSLGGSVSRLLDHVITFDWKMIDTQTDEPVGGGVDVLQLDEDGRIQVGYQFIER